VTDASVVVTLDIGGSAAKATAYDTGARATLATTSTPYPALAGSSDPGLFDPDAWWSSALRALSTLATTLDLNGRRYLGVTVSAIRIPFVLVDGRGCTTAYGLFNKDRRALGQVRELTEAFGADAVYGLTGHWPAPEFGLPKLLWVRQNWPSAWSSATTVLQLHDWFVFQLSGTTVSEPSSAAMSQMLDLAQGTWAMPLLAALDVPVERFPELRPAGSVAGGLQREVALATGLPAGLPVHVGGGDTHLSAVSTGYSRHAVPVVVAGTTAPVQIALGAPRSPTECSPLLVSPGALAGQWVLESNAGPTGSAVAELAPMTELSGEQLEAALVSRRFVIEHQIDAPLTVITGNPFFGPVGWQRALAPTVIGLRGTHTGKDVHAAALTGSCYAVVSMLSCLEKGYGERPPFVVATGGMSTSAPWCQLLADATGHQVRVRPLSRVAGVAGAVVVTGDEGLAAADDDEVLLYEQCAATAGIHLDGHARYERLYQTLQHSHDVQAVDDARTR
jgi:sugar (pentulose or hexulose) kinase